MCVNKISFYIELNMKDNIELDHDAIAHRLKEDVVSF